MNNFWLNVAEADELDEQAALEALELELEEPNLWNIDEFIAKSEAREEDLFSEDLFSGLYADLGLHKDFGKTVTFMTEITKEILSELVSWEAVDEINDPEERLDLAGEALETMILDLHASGIIDYNEDLFSMWIQDGKVINIGLRFSSVKDPQKYARITLTRDMDYHVDYPFPS